MTIQRTNAFDHIRKARKIDSLLDAPSFFPTEAQRDALRSLPVIAAENGFNPLTSRTEFGGAQTEFLVLWRGEVYYIDTQGYDYARYAARVAGCTVADFISNIGC